MGCLSLLFAILLLALPAGAATDLVFFDQLTGYGFDQSSYGLPVDFTVDNYQVAAAEIYNPYTDANGDLVQLFMFLDQEIDGEWIESCVGAGPSCVQRALIDITWNVEINEAYGTEALETVLFLAAPDRDPRFDGLGVAVRYDPSELDVIRYPSRDAQGMPYNYHFLGFDLGALVPGVDVATVNFQYELIGELPTDPGTGAPIGPGIGGGAAINQVPEPGTAVLALLGLGGLGILGRNRPWGIHLT